MDPLLSKREHMRQKHQEKRGVPATETPDSASETPPKPPKKEKPKIELMSEEDFESFWKIYPIKEERKKSSEKFLKLEKRLLPTILEAVAQNKIRNEKWIKGFAKMPTTWINSECWNDELPPLANNSTTNAQTT